MSAPFTSRQISIRLTHGPTLDYAPYVLVVIYKDGVKHRVPYDTVSELLQDLADRITDHEHYGSVHAWKVIPS